MIIPLKNTRVFRAYMGGYHLDCLEGKENPQISRFPEDWIASVTEAFNPGRNFPGEGLSQMENGEYLRDLMKKFPEEMLGGKKEMSFLFKLLDSNERLVIQAHPTVPFARQHFNSPYGKTECWYILGDGGSVYIGFQPGVTRESWKALFEKQDIPGMLDCLHRFDVKKGDFIFVSGGVPHAIGPGCLLAELQEPTDLMVIPERITPSGVTLAERKIHGGLGFEKMFDCFTYDGKTREEAKKAYFFTPRTVDDHLTRIVDSSITDQFKMVRISTDGYYEYHLSSYGVAVILSGQGMINGLPCKKNSRFFIPFAEKKISVQGQVDMLVCMP